MRYLIISFFGLILLLLNSLPASAMLYCLDKDLNAYVRTSQDAFKRSVVVGCGSTSGPQPDIEIPYEVYSKIRDLDEQYLKNLKSAPDKDKHDKEWKAATEKIILESTEQIEKFNNQNLATLKKNLENKSRLEQEAKRKKELEVLAQLEKDHGRKCSRFSNKPNEFKSCLLEKDQLAKQEEIKRKQEFEKERNRLANLPPSERYAYTCEKTYGFKKGSDNFRDCVFKIMTTEYEIQRAADQRRIAELESKINNNNNNTISSYNSELLEIERLKAKALQDQADAVRNRNQTDALMDLSRSLLNNNNRAPANVPNLPLNCRSVRVGNTVQTQCY